MSLEKITGRIIDEANAEKDEILREAREQADAIITEANTKAMAILDDAETRGHEEREKTIAARNAVINVDVRKLMLAKKQQVLKETFDKAGVDFEENKRDLQSGVAQILFPE